jgi:hypothetical protein
VVVLLPIDPSKQDYGWKAYKSTQPLPLLSSAKECRILQTNPLWQAQRFHYRHVAAQMAWEAAHLLPKECDEASAMLGEAGAWLANRDPKDADKFYKEMIWKHWSQPTARKADAQRWFPEDLTHAYGFTELLARDVPGER